jgi:hypothetical protein
MQPYWQCVSAGVSGCAHLAVVDWQPTPLVFVRMHHLAAECIAVHTRDNMSIHCWVLHTKMHMPFRAKYVKERGAFYRPVDSRVGLNKAFDLRAAGTARSHML